MDDRAEAKEEARRRRISRARRGIVEIDERDWQIVAMRKDGKSYAEIGAAVGLSKPSVGAVLKRMASVS